MKQKPDNWKNLGRDRQMRHLTRRATGVCMCNPSLGENCDACRDLPELKEEERNYHEEAMIVARSLSQESRDDDAYWMYYNLIQLDDVESFNTHIRMYFIDTESTFNDAYAEYHKSVRQCDHYNYIALVRDKDRPDADGERYVSPGILDSMLHSFMNMSEVPYNVLKKLITEL